MEKTIYLAGGCFWGVEAYFQRLKGVIDTECGYANGHVESAPSYEQVKHQETGCAETVRIVYDNETISLKQLLAHYLRFVDPYAKNKQGEDEGTQYRTGVYTVSNEGPLIRSFFDAHLKRGYLIEIEPLRHFYPAEEYHQDYLIKHPDGYCHVNLNLIDPSELK